MAPKAVEPDFFPINGLASIFQTVLFINGPLDSLSDINDGRHQSWPISSRKQN